MIKEAKENEKLEINQTEIDRILNERNNDVVNEFDNIVDDDVNNARAHEDKNHEFIEELKQSEIWLEQMQMRFKLNADEIKDKLDIFALDCRCRGTEHKNLNDTRRHFNDWLRIQIESQNRKNNDETRQKQENKRRGSDVTAVGLVTAVAWVQSLAQEFPHATGEEKKQMLGFPCPALYPPLAGSVSLETW